MATLDPQEVPLFLHPTSWKLIYGKLLAPFNISCSFMKRFSTSGEAIKLIQAKRFCIFPNEGFRRQLFEYEPILRAKLGTPKNLSSPRMDKRKERDDGDQEHCDVDL